MAEIELPMAGAGSEAGRRWGVSCKLWWSVTDWMRTVRTNLLKQSNAPASCSIPLGWL